MTGDLRGVDRVRYDGAECLTYVVCYGQRRHTQMIYSYSRPHDSLPPTDGDAVVKKLTTLTRHIHVSCVRGLVSLCNPAGRRWIILSPERRRQVSAHVLVTYKSCSTRNQGVEVPVCQLLNYFVWNSDRHKLDQMIESPSAAAGPRFSEQIH